VTGPAGIEEFRQLGEDVREIASMLRVPDHEVVAAVRKLREQARESQKRPREADRGAAEELLAKATEVGSTRVVTEAVDVPDAKALLELSDQVKQKLGDAAVVLGTAVDGRVHLVANVAPPAVERGVKAGDLVRVAAEIVGGGGGGRDTMAQAGGRNPDKLPEALAAARAAIERTLT
jgi:alanyl-tRNA synthetase